MYEYKAKCIKVIDGDTIDVWCDLGFKVSIKVRVRFARINAPEVRTRNKAEKALGIKAKDLIKQEIEKANNEVILQVLKIGKYGRAVSEVFVDGVNLSDYLLSLGLAKEVTY